MSSAGQATRRGIVTLSVALSAVLALAACGGGGGKSYDIGAVFPLTANKCAKYHGDQDGSGVTESCMVTKDECERAVADWREAMQSSGVNEALEFTCE